MKDKRCKKCDKVSHFQGTCPDNKVNVKANHVCATDQMPKGGFVATLASFFLTNLTHFQFKQGS